MEVYNNKISNKNEYFNFEFNLLIRRQNAEEKEAERQNATKLIMSLKHQQHQALPINNFFKEDQIKEKLSAQLIENELSLKSNLSLAAAVVAVASSSSSATSTSSLSSSSSSSTSSSSSNYIRENPLNKLIDMSLKTNEDSSGALFKSK